MKPPGPGPELTGMSGKIMPAVAPDSTSLRVALWRAMHVQVDPPRTAVAAHAADAAPASVPSCGL